MQVTHKGIPIAACIRKQCLFHCQRQCVVFRDRNAGLTLAALEHTLTHLRQLSFLNIAGCDFNDGEAFIALFERLHDAPVPLAFCTSPVSVQRVADPSNVLPMASPTVAPQKINKSALRYRCPFELECRWLGAVGDEVRSMRSRLQHPHAPTLRTPLRSPAFVHGV